MENSAPVENNRQKSKHVRTTSDFNNNNDNNNNNNSSNNTNNNNYYNTNDNDCENVKTPRTKKSHSSKAIDLKDKESSSTGMSSSSSLLSSSQSEQDGSTLDTNIPKQQSNNIKPRHSNHHIHNNQRSSVALDSPVNPPAVKGSRGLKHDTTISSTQARSFPNPTVNTNSKECNTRPSESYNTPTTQNAELVMKAIELQSPNTILRNRKTHRSTSSLSAPENSQNYPTLPDDDSGVMDYSNDSSDNNNQRISYIESSAPGALPRAVERKPSLSTVRGHVPSVINTEPGPFKLYVHESSPVETSLKHAQLSEKDAGKIKDGAGPANENGGEISGTDEDDDDFDWEEHKIYEPAKDDSEVNEKVTMIETDVCCRPLHHRIHPWAGRTLKNLLVILILLIPRFILTHIHTHHHDTIVLIDGGRPYMAVVIGNHISYFIIQFLIMGLFKIIYQFGSVKVKITLETHDGLVPHIARSVWLFTLIPFWVVFVHSPTCMKAKSRLDLDANIAEGVDMYCRRWIFWWVNRCLWGIQAMNMLYILKRYTMQILSDRFEQDNSKFVELNFHGHVFDGLQKIKYHRSHRNSVLNGHHYRWAEKSTSWLASTYQGTKSPSMSRPNSSKDERPPLTASVISETAQQRSTWELIKRSVKRRNLAKKRAKSTNSSPSGSPTDIYRDHDLEPQEFVRMSKKRKSKLINNFRNKPIENPYKKAKDLWSRICPPHRNHLERIDLEQPFKKEIFERVWKLFCPGGDGGDVVTRPMFKKAIVDMVNLRKSFTSTHRTFENAMAKLNMLFNFIVLLFVIVAFLIAYDVGVQQYAVGVSSLVVGGAFVTGTSAKNAFESMIFIFVIGAYFLIVRIHILTTEMRRGDGMRVIIPNYVLATRQTNNLSRSDNMYMDIPLFSTARTIQRLKQRIQTFVEGEALPDFQKIDVILNATNNHTKDGTSKACLQILFRVFHRCRWVDSDYGPRKLKAVLFLRATLNDLEQEDLNDLIAIRRSLGYGNHGPQDGQQQKLQQQVLNEAGEPVGFVGTSGNVYDSPRNNYLVNPGYGPGRTHGDIGAQAPNIQGELGALYLSHQGSPISTTEQILYADANNPPPRYPQEQRQNTYSGTDNAPQGSSQAQNGFSNHNLGARHVLAPETIQLSTNAANFQPFPNGFQFQR
ncbi:hypothetical protein BGZ76_001325 [Entomortierella beljakovae]|nr:hypothetical protein BGZ76_001325 [Entomortierella beljakovae]